MTTEQKIREAWFCVEPATHEDMQSFDYFRTGYLAMLNELEPSYLVKDNDMLYRLSKGVTKP